MSAAQVVTPPLSAFDNSSSSMYAPRPSCAPVTSPTAKDAFRPVALPPTPPISPVELQLPWPSSRHAGHTAPAAPASFSSSTTITPAALLAPLTADAKARFKVARHYRERDGHFMRTRIGGSTKASAQLTLALARAQADRLQAPAAAATAAATIPQHAHAHAAPYDMQDVHQLGQAPAQARALDGAVENALGLSAAVALSITSRAAQQQDLPSRMDLLHELIDMDIDMADDDHRDGEPACSQVQLREIMAALSTT